MDVSPFFKLMVDRAASYLFFSVGAAPHIRIEGVTSPIGEARLKSQQVREMALTVMSDEQRVEFEKSREVNVVVSMIGVGRFSVTIFRQRSEIAMVVKYLKGVVIPLQDLLLPPCLTDLVMGQRGLVLIAGTAESGKSTTMAAMLEYRNQNHPGHILTIEDPIEYLYQHKQSIVDQREVGIDTQSYDSALKYALRAAPDMILLSEISQASTLKATLFFVEKGPLCLSSIYAEGFNQTLSRMINFFHDVDKKQILQALAINLKAIISLKLIPGLQQKRVPIVEILMNTSPVADLIERGAFDDIYSVLEKDKDNGMQTFDQSIVGLYEAGKITKKIAMRYAQIKHEMGLKVHYSEETLSNSGDTLSLKPEEE